MGSMLSVEWAKTQHVSKFQESIGDHPIPLSGSLVSVNRILYGHKRASIVPLILTKEKKKEKKNCRNGLQTIQGICAKPLSPYAVTAAYIGMHKKQKYFFDHLTARLSYKNFTSFWCFQCLWTAVKLKNGTTIPPHSAKSVCADLLVGYTDFFQTLRYLYLSFIRL